MTALRDRCEQVQGGAARPASAPDRRTERRKPYIQPEIIHELVLETRAGSPLIIDPNDPFNLLGTDLE